jgi:hypothetical protein
LSKLGLEAMDLHKSSVVEKMEFHSHSVIQTDLYVRLGPATEQFRFKRLFSLIAISELHAFDGQTLAGIERIPIPSVII